MSTFDQQEDKKQEIGKYSHEICYLIKVSTANPSLYQCLAGTSTCDHTSYDIFVSFFNVPFLNSHRTVPLACSFGKRSTRCHRARLVSFTNDAPAADQCVRSYLSNAPRSPYRPNFSSYSLLSPPTLSSSASFTRTNASSEVAERRNASLEIDAVRPVARRRVPCVDQQAAVL